MNIAVLRLLSLIAKAGTGNQPDDRPRLPLRRDVDSTIGIVPRYIACADNNRILPDGLLDNFAARYTRFYLRGKHIGQLLLRVDSFQQRALITG